MPVVRPYTCDDLAGLLQIQRECFPPPFPEALWWQPAQIASHVERFPAGALCAVAVDQSTDGAEPGELLGSATALIIRFDPAHPRHTWAEVADQGYIRTHDPSGDTLYGIDVAVRPAWRGRGVARALYQARFDLVRRLGLRRFLAGSRISGYHRHAGRLSPEAYVEAVLAGSLADPVITPQLRAGLRPVALVPGYIEDAEAHDHALLMEWPNPEIGDCLGIGQNGPKARPIPWDVPASCEGIPVKRPPDVPFRVQSGITSQAPRS